MTEDAFLYERVLIFNQLEESNESTCKSEVYKF